MKKIIDWAKNNKLKAALIIGAVYFIFFSDSSPGGLLSGVQELSTPASISSNKYYGAEDVVDFAASEMMMGRGGGYAPAPQVTPQMDIADRMVVTDSRLSILVKDVRQALDQIQSQTETKGGYMVNTHMTTPEEGATGYITIRVPLGALKPMLEFLRNVGVRVVSENISGYDVTDQYVDSQARLTTLERTKAIFKDIMEKATDVDEILRVQQKILSTQSQIDNLKGQLKYMEATSSSSLITINLATDELALPFSPGQPWRPSVVLKYATRSLVKTLRGLGSLAIWVGVYAIVWVPALIVLIVIKKILKKRKERTSVNQGQ